MTLKLATSCLALTVIAWTAIAAPAPKPAKPVTKPPAAKPAKPKVYGAAALSKTHSHFPALPAGQAYALTFNDEFRSLETTKKKWTIVDENRTCRDKNWWGPQAVKVCNGKLECWAMKHPTKPDWHITASLRTRGKFKQAYGLYVNRVKFQTEKGFWSAFWMMCGEVNRVGDDGRDGTEIDIWEKNTLDDDIQHTLHWDGYGKAHKSAGKRSKSKTAMTGYHTISLLWTPKEYVYYVDGKETWRTSAGGVCNVAGYLKISGEKGTWAGDINKAKLPNAFYMDYVRVYQIVAAKTKKPIYTPKTKADFPTKPKPEPKPKKK